MNYEPYYQSHQHASSTEIAITIVLLIGIALWAWLTDRIKGVPSPLASQKVPVESSAIWVAATDNRIVMRLSHGSFDNFPYVYYAAVSVFNGGTPILEITLPETSPVHIMCFNSQKSNVSKQWQTAVTDSLLEPATLEGDFPEQFKLYTSKDTQLEIREVFDPGTMAYFMDFCENFDFEVFGKSMFIASHSAESGTDTTSVPEDAAKLAKMVSKQIGGWSALNPEVPKKEYNAMDHFLGDPKTLDADDQFRMGRGGA